MSWAGWRAAFWPIWAPTSSRSSRRVAIAAVRNGAPSTSTSVFVSSIRRSRPTRIDLLSCLAARIFACLHRPQWNGAPLSNPMCCGRSIRGSSWSSYGRLAPRGRAATGREATWKSWRPEAPCRSPGKLRHAGAHQRAAIAGLGGRTGSIRGALCPLQTRRDRPRRSCRSLRPSLHRFRALARLLLSILTALSRRAPAPSSPAVPSKAPAIGCSGPAATAISISSSTAERRDGAPTSSSFVDAR